MQRLATIDSAFDARQQGHFRLAPQNSGTPPRRKSSRAQRGADDEGAHMRHAAHERSQAPKRLHALASTSTTATDSPCDRFYPTSLSSPARNGFRSCCHDGTGRLVRLQSPCGDLEESKTHRTTGDTIMMGSAYLRLQQGEMMQTAKVTQLGMAIIIRRHSPHRNA